MWSEFLGKVKALKMPKNLSNRLRGSFERTDFRIPQNNFTILPLVHICGDEVLDFLMIYKIFWGRSRIASPYTNLWWWNIDLLPKVCPNKSIFFFFVVTNSLLDRSLESLGRFLEDSTTPELAQAILTKSPEETWTKTSNLVSKRKFKS